MTSLRHTSPSLRGRIAAAATAGLALATVGIVALTSGTLAAETSTIKAKQSVGIEGIREPIGIARTVALGLDYRYDPNGHQNQELFSATVDTRSGNVKNTTFLPSANAGWDLPGGQVGIKTLQQDSAKGCASTNGNGNGNRCLRPQNLSAWDNDSQSNWYSGIDNNSALVDASSGGPYSLAGKSQKYQARIMQINDFWPHVDIHDSWTNVQCHSNGDVSAAAPRSWYQSTTHTSPWNTSIGAPIGGHTPPKNTSENELATNHYKVYRNRVLNRWDVMQYFEVRSYRQTFSNPPRALSALVILASSWDNGRRINDWSFVTKSECAVSPDGSIDLDPAVHFERAVPARKVHAWNGSGNNSVGANGPIEQAVNTVSERQAIHNRASGAEEAPVGLELIEEGALEVIDPLTGAPAGDAEAPVDRESPEGATGRNTSAPATPTTAPTTSAATTTTSAGPDPTTAGRTYYAADGSTYQRSGGGTLTAAQRAQVDEAILLSESAESGELGNGARYEAAEYQLDGTTLIITNADGGTLRIVREK